MNNSCCCNNKNSKEKIKINLKNLPLTESYSKKFNKNYFKANQTFNFCNICNHGYLSKIIEPKTLYSNIYYFRTSKSITSSAGSIFFLNFLNSNKKTNNNIALDIGCNDLFILNKLKKTQIKIGIDPIQRNNFKKIFFVYKGNYEEISLEKFKNKIDLVVCRHTIEHIVNLDFFFKKLYKDTSKNCDFFLEFPSLNLLVENYRFDQIFHQHVHYFSLNSINKYLKKYNFEIKDYKFNEHHWGALLVYFKKKNSNDKKKYLKMKNKTLESNKYLNSKEILKRYESFKLNMKILKQTIMKLDKDTIYLYGASQMLPVILYHLNLNTNMVKAIIDDDKTKKNLTYNNIDLKIKKTEFHKNQIKKLNFLITAPDNAATITKKLIDLRPKNIFNLVRSI